MCGRYSNEAEFSHIRLLFQAVDQTFRPWTPKYNIAPSSGPGHEQLIVTADRSGTKQIQLARFWLIPTDWSKPLRMLPTSFNARSEDLDRRQFWREPYAHTRCLVPATGWREFTGDSSPKQPFHFRLPAGSEPAPTTFSFAGLWSTWTSPDGEVVDSFAILTTEPSSAAAPIHDRMPVVLPSTLEETWLLGDADRARALREAQEYTRSLELDIFPSDPAANSVQYEGPAAVRRAPPVAAPTARKSSKTAASAQLSLLDEPTKKRRSRS